MNMAKINALNNAAETKSHKTFIKVKAVLQVMQAKALPINFESVAKLASVSKTWLYKEPLIAVEIKKARVKEGPLSRLLDYQSILEKREIEMMELKTKNKLLKNQVKQLQDQLEVVYGELYNAKNQGKFKVIK
jgi:hypothetical protein